MVDWAVELAKLAIAEAEIQKALIEYRQSVQKVKTAGDRLAANWEGEAQKAFVAEHEKAYQWHVSIMDIVASYMNTLKETAQKYAEAEGTVKSLIGG
ncbi:MAG: WXG100 family type VII secretion target [Oscillospiraceae bacterium]|nr:WXG100 family type VII secretion target [Oscillospiraceae bacterium]